MDRDQQLQELLRSYGERDRVERNLQNTLNQWFPNPRQNVSRRREQRMAQTRPLQHQCGLCGNEMRLPTTLAVCNHSFCRDCLKDHVNRSVDKRCPLCKQVRVSQGTRGELTSLWLDRSVCTGMPCKPCQARWKGILPYGACISVPLLWVVRQFSHQYFKEETYSLQ